MRQKGKRVKPRAYQAAAINGYRHEREKTPISSGIQRFSRIGTASFSCSSVCDSHGQDAGLLQRVQGTGLITPASGQRALVCSTRRRPARATLRTKSGTLMAPAESCAWMDWVPEYTRDTLCNS
ncbi:hypothetical protein ALP10_100794 [Pseudomonas syringae pv. helianthi]|uniref:Uncharacterized protein n=1 Tax=Pseudomonas syringae pv. helianthi TaxID=251654 RepID=A0A3M6D9G8_9PSED|nr:hypothetical protein ALP10_100794 [Pseudomonas syringae pv. helianthi]